MADQGAIGRPASFSVNSGLMPFPVYVTPDIQSAVRQDGFLVGTVRNPAGAYMANVKVTVHHLPSARPIAVGWSDASGNIRIGGLDVITQSYFAVCHDLEAAPDYQYLIRSFIK